MSLNVDQDSRGYFEQNYKDYYRQNPPYKIARYLEVVSRFQKAGGNLLDIGCGYGLFLEEAQKFYKVYGIEMHEYALEAANKRLVDVPIRNDALPTISFAEQMSVITLFDVIEHVPDLSSSF